ncbi:MAG: hypothetical protein LBO82_03815, partial [Synergistaceae bacterium]|nr:hypothetical protein [Synergistaceae bacterium]
MADIVTFDPAYFQELIKDLEGASQSLISAQDSLQKASVGLDSGLVAFAMCCTLNDDIKKVKKTAEGFLDEASGLSRALTGGVMRVNGWENTTKS